MMGKKDNNASSTKTPLSVTRRNTKPSSDHTRNQEAKAVAEVAKVNPRQVACIQSRLAQTNQNMGSPNTATVGTGNQFMTSTRQTSYDPQMEMLLQQMVHKLEDEERAIALKQADGYLNMMKAASENREQRMAAVSTVEKIHLAMTDGYQQAMSKALEETTKQKDQVSEQLAIMQATPKKLDLPLEEEAKSGQKLLQSGHQKLQQYFAATQEQPTPPFDFSAVAGTNGNAHTSSSMDIEEDSKPAAKF